MRPAITPWLPLTAASSLGALRPMAACKVHHAGIQRASISLSSRMNPQELPGEDEEEGEEQAPLPEKKRRMPFPSPFGRNIETTISFKSGLWRRPREARRVLKEFRSEPQTEGIFGKRIEIPDFLRGALKLFDRKR